MIWEHRVDINYKDYYITITITYYKLFIENKTIAWHTSVTFTYNSIFYAFLLIAFTHKKLWFKAFKDYNKSQNLSFICTEEEKYGPSHMLKF